MNFSVLVVGENPEAQIKRFDRNREVEMHIVKTKAQVISQERAKVEAVKCGEYLRYLEDKEKYKQDRDACQYVYFLENEFPQILKMTDEELYENYMYLYQRSIETGEEWLKIDDDGNLWTTENPNGKFNEHEVGGIYSGRLVLKPGAKPIKNMEPYFTVDVERAKLLTKMGHCDAARKGDIANYNDWDFVSDAIVMYGKWYSKKNIDCFGLHSGPKEWSVWEKDFYRILEDVSDDEILTIYHCSI